MRPVTIKEVTTALRSGEYKQNIGRLHDVANDSFCVMGVAEDVAGTQWDAEGHDEAGFQATTCVRAAQMMGEWGRFIFTATKRATFVVSELQDANDTLNETLPQLADRIDTLAVELGFVSPSAHSLSG